jgi:Zn-finger nucleic acid-binding protein
MKCPRDGTELVAERYEAKIEIESCPSCQGAWLDKGELEAIQSTIERDYRRELDDDSTGDEVSHVVEPIRCPKCGGEMETREHGYCSRVIIDTCLEGCGVWLDTGELRALEKFYERQQREDAGDVVTWLYASLLTVFHRPKRARKPGAAG